MFGVSGTKDYRTNLHSNIVLLKEKTSDASRSSQVDLHSNIVLLKDRLEGLILKNCLNLHSNIVLLKATGSFPFEFNATQFTF